MVATSFHTSTVNSISVLSLTANLFENSSTVLHKPPTFTKFLSGTDENQFVGPVLMNVQPFFSKLFQLYSTRACNSMRSHKLVADLAHLRATEFSIVRAPITKHWRPSWPGIGTSLLFIAISKGTILDEAQCWKKNRVDWFQCLERYTQTLNWIRFCQVRFLNSEEYISLLFYDICRSKVIN